MTMKMRHNTYTSSCLTVGIENYGTEIYCNDLYIEQTSLNCGCHVHLVSLTDLSSTVLSKKLQQYGVLT